MKNISKKLFAGIAAAVLATAVVAAPAQAIERDTYCNAPKNIEPLYIGGDLVAVGLKGNVAEYSFLNSQILKDKLDWIATQSFLGAQDAAKVTFTGTQFNIDQVLTTAGEFNADANVEIHASVEGNKGINFINNVNMNGDAQKLMLFSEEGDIVFGGSNNNLKGLIYAPNGVVSFNSAYTNLNDCVIIAKGINVDDECQAFNFNGSDAVNDMLATAFCL